MFLLPYHHWSLCESCQSWKHLPVIIRSSTWSHCIKVWQNTIHKCTSTIKLADIYEHQIGGPLPLYIHNQAASICHKACDNHSLMSTTFPCICLLYWMEGVPETPCRQMGYGRGQKMPGRANAMSEVLTAIDSTTGSSGGMTELIKEQFSNNLYSLTLCWVFQVYRNNFPPIHMLSRLYSHMWVAGLCNWLLTKWIMPTECYPRHHLSSCYLQCKLKAKASK